MKKLILLTTLFAILSCSSSDDKAANSNTTSINPPAWIQGTWKDKDNFEGFKFTNNDFCIISSAGYVTTTDCFGKSLPVMNLKETINNTDYILEITLGSATFKYHFKKISATKIQWEVIEGGMFNPIYTKQ